MWCAATSASGVCAYMCIMECKTNEQNQIAYNPVHSIATLGGKKLIPKSIQSESIISRISCIERTSMHFKSKILSDCIFG